MQFTSLKTGLQNLQNRIQCAPAVDNALPLEHETEASRIMASIGNISCLGNMIGHVLMVLVTPEYRAVRRRRERMCSDGAILRIQDCSHTFSDASTDADCNHANGRERHHVQVSKRAI